MVKIGQIETDKGSNMVAQYPPALTVKEAIKIISSFHAFYGEGETEKKVIANIIGMSARSSNFPPRFSALTKYGLIEKSSGGKIKLTELAKCIVNAKDQELYDLTVKLFNHNRVMEAVLQKYPAANVPDNEILSEYLVEKVGVVEKALEAWVNFILISFDELTEMAYLQFEESESDIESDIEDLIDLSSGDVMDSGRSDLLITFPTSSGDVIKIIIPPSSSTRELKSVRSILEGIIKDKENEE